MRRNSICSKGAMKHGYLEGITTLIFFHRVASGKRKQNPILFDGWRYLGGGD
jgi:hypothetical protein